jgi:hypothetical protein
MLKSTLDYYATKPNLSCVRYNAKWNNADGGRAEKNVERQCSAVSSLSRTELHGRWWAIIPQQSHSSYILFPSSGMHSFY